MKRVPPSHSVCPSPEELSAWVDGYGDPASREHADSCPECQGKLQTYQRLDGAVRAALLPPEGLAERIKLACRELPDKPPAPIPIWRTALRCAAGVAFASVLIGGLTVLLKRQDQQGQAARLDERQEAQAQAARGEERPEAGDAVASDAAADPIRPRDVAKAAAGQGGDGAGHRQYHLAPSRVLHVWVVDDLAESRRRFVASLPEDSSHTEAAGVEDGAAYQVLLPDRELQELVDKLAASGWSLVSPGFPQPGRGAELMGTGRVVRYDVHFVPGK